MLFFKLTTIFIALSIFVNSAKAKVDPKNYDFTYDKFKIFYPGNSLDQVKKNYPKPELISKKGAFENYKVDIIHVRYKFPVFFQVKDNKIVDFFAKLPSYFIHDIFHQSLINRFGMQNKYSHKDGTSFYVWNNADGLLLTYSGACTITCFPIFLHGISNKDQTVIKESFLKKMLDSTKGLLVK